MDDGTGHLNDWGNYLKRIQNRPGWSVARLAREANIHRATVFEWIKGGGESVTVGSVLAVADAVGDHPLVALRAAAGLLSAGDGADDPEIAEIVASGLPDRVRQELVEYLIEQRARDEERRREEVRRMIRLAGGRTA